MRKIGKLIVAGVLVLGALQFVRPGIPVKPATAGRLPHPDFPGTASVRCRRSFHTRQ